MSLLYMTRLNKTESTIFVLLCVVFSNGNIFGVFFHCSWILVPRGSCKASMLTSSKRIFLFFLFSLEPFEPILVSWKIESLNSFGTKFQTTFVVCFSFLTNYRLKSSLYVKLKDRMSNSVDPDETAHMSRLIWIYAVCKSLLLLPVAVKELKLVLVGRTQSCKLHRCNMKSLNESETPIFSSFI